MLSELTLCPSKNRRRTLSEERTRRQTIREYSTTDFLCLQPDWMLRSVPMVREVLFHVGPEFFEHIPKRVCRKLDRKLFDI